MKGGIAWAEGNFNPTAATVVADIKAQDTIRGAFIGDSPRCGALSTIDLVGSKAYYGSTWWPASNRPQVPLVQRFPDAPVSGFTAATSGVSWKSTPPAPATWVCEVPPHQLAQPDIVNRSTQVKQRVLVVGGGISGLAAAQRLHEIAPNIELTLLEAGGRLGGVLDTVRRDGFLIERSADNFITDPAWALEYCRHLGIDDALVPTSSQERGAMVVARGRLEKVPEGFMLMAPRKIWPLVTTPILSPLGKLRLLAESLVPRRAAEADESLASFARRRLGREVFDRIVQPLVGGIYTADPEKLSLRATLPRFIEMEQRYGSLIRAAFAKKDEPDGSGELIEEGRGGARYGLFVTPRDGLASLVTAIADRLPAASIRLNTPVAAIARNPDGSWRLELEARQGGDEQLIGDAVLIAVPADRAAKLLAGLDGELAARLGRIPYAGSVVLSFGFRRQDIAHPLDGFGFVVPAVEQRRILAASFSSVKFAGRAPAGCALVRVFIGGACQSELTELDDAALTRIALEELAALVGLRGAPIVSDIARWPHSMPQYHLGHGELVATIESRVAAWPTLALAGNAYHGVGIPNCVRSGQLAAERVAAALSAVPAP
jgi:oxygen-dependent protoporphyrinogen oxidase